MGWPDETGEVSGKNRSTVDQGRENLEVDLSSPETQKILNQLIEQNNRRWEVELEKIVQGHQAGQIELAKESKRVTEELERELRNSQDTAGRLEQSLKVIQEKSDTDERVVKEQAAEIGRLERERLRGIEEERASAELRLRAVREECEMERAKALESW